MYWNVSLVAGVHCTWSWIVALDVLKYSWVSYNKQRELSWIVTLDVLKLLNEYLNGDYTGSWIVTLYVLKWKWRVVYKPQYSVE